MRYGCVCSGIGSATVAWAPLGWTPVFFAETDKFASAVLAHHWPEIPNLGDFTKIEASDVGPIDLLVGGTPCQSFSVAGKRLGLDDPRGNLALEFCRLARRLRPRFLVWENVPGVHSSWSGGPQCDDIEGDEDSDFGAFLDALEECGYSACWRVLDVQYVRVESHPRAAPQRRERVILVGYLGDWRPPAAILLEPEGMQGDPPPRRQARQAIAGSLGAGSARSGGRVGRREAAANHVIPVRAKALSAARGRSTSLADDQETYVPVAFGGNDTRGAIEVATACRAKGGTGHGDFESETVVIQLPAVVGTLPAAGGTERKHGQGWGQQEWESGFAIPFDTTQITHPENRSQPGPGSPCHPLAAKGHPPAVAFSCKDHGADASDDVSPTLRAMGFAQSHDNGGGQVAVAVADPISTKEGETYTHEGENNFRLRNVVPDGMAVRRLTPLECERLQGLPSTSKTAILRICRSFDHHENNALAARLNLRSLQSVSHADGREFACLARPADGSLSTNLLDLAQHAVLNVRIDCERGVAQIHSREKLLWSASIVARASSPPLAVPAADFARVAALTTTTLVPTTDYGEAASQLNGTASFAHWSGSGFALLCGREIDGLVGDAARFTMAWANCMKSTTSAVGPNSKNSDWISAISSCCVIAAISGYIPDAIREAPSFDVSVEVVSNHTSIIYRGKPAADGPRYKAIGNAMGVNVMRWVGERIDLFEQVTRRMGCM